MPRKPAEIAQDFREAVTAMASVNLHQAQQLNGHTGTELPAIEVRLNDGRVVELGALADELVQATA